MQGRLLKHQNRQSRQPATLSNLLHRLSLQLRIHKVSLKSDKDYLESQTNCLGSQKIQSTGQTDNLRLQSDCVEIWVNRRDFQIGRLDRRDLDCLYTKR